MSGILGRWKQIQELHASRSIDAQKSRYGYTWRGIVRPHDREMGIAGGEIIVLDLETNEVLGGAAWVYSRLDNVRNNLTGVWWLTGKLVPTINTEAAHRAMIWPIGLLRRLLSQ